MNSSHSHERCVILCSLMWESQQRNRLFVEILRDPKILKICWKRNELSWHIFERFRFSGGDSIQIYGESQTSRKTSNYTRDHNYVCWHLEQPCVTNITAVPCVNRGFSLKPSQNHRGRSGQIYDNPKFLSKVQNSQWRLGEWNGLSEASQTPSYGPLWSLGRNARSKSQSRDNERFIRS